MEGKKNYKSALTVKSGIQQPPSVNPDVLNGKKRKRRKNHSAEEFVSGILAGNRTILSQAITLAESSLSEHYDSIQEIIEKCLPFSGRSVRIGITGVPGAGKSTFIESFGSYITGTGRKLAVLAIDPSSRRTKGSILGDKTRMERLSVDPNAYIRPSPSAGTLGGVARKTRETIILCEAAGFDTILVETVGVGQSETAAQTMVDFFLLLALAGAGDELQGIKRGILEMTDAIAINKADGSNRMAAEAAMVMYRNSLNLYPVPPSGWKQEVMICSAIENSGIAGIWEKIMDYVEFTRRNGYFNDRRKQQAIMRMHDTINDYLTNSFYKNKNVMELQKYLEHQLHEGTITSYNAALKLIDAYYKK